MKSDAILTKTETKVAIAYTLGDIGKEVGVRLGIAYNTVVRHTQNIYDKTGIRRSTNALVAWFLTTNYDIDLAEMKRRLGATLLLGLMVAQICSLDPIVRRAARRGRRTNDVEWIVEY